MMAKMAVSRVYKWCLVSATRVFMVSWKADITRVYGVRSSTT